jgi:hypothetical protein
LTIPIGFHVLAWIKLPKSMWKQANFHMDYALYRLDMVAFLMANLKYLSLHFFLRYFEYSYRIPCVSMNHIAKPMWKQANIHMDLALYG